jgi:hypothetical protein
MACMVSTLHFITVGSALFLASRFVSKVIMFNHVLDEVCSGVPPSSNFEPTERLRSSDTLS